MLHLARVAFGQLARADPDRVFQANARVATHRDGLRSDRQLVAAGAQYAPLVVAAEQAIRGALHHRNVLGMRTDAAQDAEHRLDEKWRLDQPAVGEVPQRVEMADVVALDLEAGAV